jgi:Integrase zinc binding domain
MVFLRLDDKIYVPNVEDLRLRVLQSKHDHILLGHFGINKTLGLICRDYDWPGIRSFIKEYCKSCTTCMRSKPQHCYIPVTPHQTPDLWTSGYMLFLLIGYNKQLYSGCVNLLVFPSCSYCPTPCNIPPLTLVVLPIRPIVPSPFGLHSFSEATYMA